MRDMALAPPGTWAACRAQEKALHRRDRVFFYRRLVVAEALPAAAPAAPTPAAAHDERRRHPLRAG
jgi:hypothetical protein